MSEPLVDFSARHRTLLLSLVALFVVMLGMRLHGYSFPCWHEYIDHTPPAEVLAGHLRSIRSDDWLLDLPVAIAQVNHDPRFPIINTNIGEGQNMLLPIRAPVRGIQFLFRPTTWGFLLGADQGLSWSWWAMSLGLFYAYFLVFMILTGNRFGLSVAGGLLVLYSPFFQYWSLHKAPIAIHMALMFVGLMSVLFSRRRPIILAGGLLLGWAAVCYAVEFLYPPFQVSVGYLLILLASGVIWERRASCFLDQRATRIVGLGLAGALAAIGLVSFYSESAEAIRLASHTVYPGQRFSAGGGFPYHMIFADDFLAHKFVRDWNQLGNSCEGSSFFLLSPLLFFVVLWRRFRHGERIGGLLLSLFAYNAFLIAYAVYGLPEWLARATLFGRLTSNRVAMALGLSDTLILLQLFSRAGGASLSPKTRLVLSLVWFGLMLAFGLHLHQAVLGYTLLLVAILALFHAILAYWCFSASRARMIPLLAGLSVFYTIGYNPLVQGGTAYLFENPLSRKILELDRQAGGGKGTWAVISDTVGPDGRAWMLPNVFRMIGVRGIGGYNGIPQLALWRRIDPSGHYEHVYNESAFFGFKLAVGEEALFTELSSGNIMVSLPASSEAWERLGVDYLVVTGGNSGAFEGSRNLEPVFSFQENRIFRVKHWGNMPALIGGGL